MPYGQPGGFNQRPPQSSSKGGLVVGIVVAVVALLCVGGVVAAVIADQKQKATFAPLKTVCSGQGVASARMYNPATPPHNVVGVSRSSPTDDWDVSMSLIPSGRRATTVAGTDIVMCFEPVIEQTLGTCDTWRTRNGIRVPGSTRNFPRVQLFRPVRLVSAQTGVTLAQGTLAGGEPSGCNVTFGNPSASTFRGSSPDSSQVNDFLAPRLGN